MSASYANSKAVASIREQEIFTSKIKALGTIAKIPDDALVIGYPIEGVRITPNYLGATDGNCLAMIPHEFKIDEPFTYDPLEGCEIGDECEKKYPSLTNPIPSPSAETHIAIALDAEILNRLSGALLYMQTHKKRQVTLIIHKSDPKAAICVLPINEVHKGIGILMPCLLSEAPVAEFNARAEGFIKVAEK